MLLWTAPWVSHSFSRFTIGRIPNSAPPHPAYLEAKTAYLRGDLKQTRDLLLRHPDSLKDNPAASFLLGKVYFFDSDYGKAEEVWKGVAEAHPTHADSRKWLARIYLVQGKAEEAERKCAELLSGDSDNPELLFLLGKARSQKGDMKGALEYLEKAEINLRRQAELLLESADLYRKFGLKNRSKEKLQLALHLLGRDSSLYRSVEQALKTLEEL